MELPEITMNIPHNYNSIEAKRKKEQQKEEITEENYNETFLSLVFGNRKFLNLHALKERFP